MTTAEVAARPLGAGVAVISIVVCTTGHRPTLRPLLEQLVDLDDPAFEVVVVENARVPTLPTDELARLGVRHVLEQRIGLDVARNRGLAEATGELVAYVDDDCVVDPGWLTGLRKAFADREVDLVTGRVLPADLSRPSQQAFQIAFPWDRGIFPVRFDRRADHPWFPASTYHLGTGCNMAFRRDALERIGGFDETLDMGTLIGGGGDLDAFARLIDVGGTACYEPTAVVRHVHRGTMADLRWQVWGYGLAQGAVMAKGVLTRRGQRRTILRFWAHRVGTRLGELDTRVRHGDGLPRSVLALEAVGLVVGPLAYPVSVVQAWLRRRRR
jgi:GT2 family glycosyltransferase